MVGALATVTLAAALLGDSAEVSAEEAVYHMAGSLYVPDASAASIAHAMVMYKNNDWSLEHFAISFKRSEVSSVDWWAVANEVGPRADWAQVQRRAIAHPDVASTTIPDIVIEGGIWVDPRTLEEPVLSKREVAQSAMGHLIYHIFYYDEAAFPKFKQIPARSARQAVLEKLTKYWRPLLVVRGGRRLSIAPSPTGLREDWA